MNSLQNRRKDGLIGIIDHDDSLEHLEGMAVIYSIANAKRQFSDLVKRAAYKGETITVGTRGKPEAALISVEELRRLQHLELERDARLLAEVVRRSGGTVGIEELLRAWGDVHPAGRLTVTRTTSAKTAARKPAAKPPHASHRERPGGRRGTNAHRSA